MTDRIQAVGLASSVAIPTEAEFNAMREVNNSKYAASGFVHYGKHITVSSFPTINEGLNGRTDSPNHILMGRITTGQQGGTSKTAYPVTNIAGFISNIIGANDNPAVTGAKIKFPEAPNGTVIYDSSGDARGTGKANLNLRTEQDPKYSNVASTDNEAVARAFEGYVKNGDFRFGDNGDWAKSSHAGNTVTITNGNATIVKVAADWSYFEQQNILVVGKEYLLSFYCDFAGQIYVGGAQVSIKEGLNEIRFTAATTTAAIQVTADGTYNFKNVSFRPTTEEVVTERVDMFGGEFFLEEVSQANPFVYDRGMVQSQSTAINGVGTSRSNRPDSYYAVFDGDTGSAGKGVDFFAASDVDKEAIIKAEGINLYRLDDGRIVQWRMRQRTIAGAGNGDWRNVNPNGVGSTTADLLLNWDSATRVRAQGGGDVPMTGSTGYYASSNLTQYNQKPELGLFTARYPSNVVNYECYFHVWGVVPRLNQGAYHPSLNPLGARMWRDAQGSTLNWSRHWHNISNASCKPSTTAQAFDVQPTGGSPKPCASSTSGFISAPAGSGRSDGRFYDAIYAGGQGGVIDYRLSAWDMSSKEEASKIFQKVVNGTYRGEERAVWTGFVNTESHSNSGIQSYTPLANMKFQIGIECPNEAKGTSASNVVSTSTAVYNVTRDAWCTNYWFAIGAFYFNNSSNTQVGDVLLVTEYSDSSVSGAFTMQDVVGFPDRILQIPELANGWLGGWIPNISFADELALTRKNIGSGSSVTITYTGNSGNSWTNTPWNFDKTTNETSLWNIRANPGLITYTAFAKQTKESTNKPVLNGSQGLGNVNALMWNTPLYGCTFAESLLGKVITNGDTNSGVNTNLGDSGLTINTNGNNLLGDEFGGTANSGHNPVTFGAPTNDSPAVKALWYQTSDNGQVGLNFAYNELVYNSGGTVGNEWGDTTAATTYTNASGQVRITDGQSTYTNLNGDTCLYGTNELAIPYGYTKNMARAGSQTKGVDLLSTKVSIMPTYYAPVLPSEPEVTIL